jgi:hypothetical protein
MHEIDLPRGRDLSPRRGKRRRHTPGALATLLVAALAAACTDNGVEPTPAVTPAPAAPARAFVSPVADAPMSAASLYVPASNAVRWGEVPWTELPADFGDAGWVELRTTGQVSWTINTATYAVNSWYCHGSNAYPYYGEGSAGGAGNASSNLRMTALVSSAAPADDDYGALMVNRGAGQVYRLSAARPGARLYAKRSGLPGVCNGSPWYNFTGEHTVEVVKVVPVQVAPNKPEFLPGEVLTWTARLYEGVTETNLRWTFERTDGEVEYPSCSSSTCHYAPRGPGRMKVAGKWELAAPTVHVHNYSAPVTIRQPKLQVKCAPARLPKGNATKCVASVDLPVSTFAVQSWSYSGTAAPAASAGDVKEWTFKPGEVAAGTVTVTALVGTGTQTATVQVEVVCNFFREPTGDPILDRADVQDRLRQLWTESNPDDPGPGRIEKGLVISEHGGQYVFNPYLGTSTRCTSAAGAMSIPSNEIVAIVHTHPDPPGTPFPFECNPSYPGANVGHNPSQADINSQSALSNATGRRIPSYIVEKNHVHRHGQGISSLTGRRNHTC